MPYQRQKTDYLAEKFTPDKKEMEKKGRNKKKRALSFLNALCKLTATYSPTWCSSTIGANGLNFSVRYG